MKKVLIVDDSKTILTMLKIEFDELDDIEAIYADSYKSAVKKIRENKGDMHAALLDVNLPDAPKGEVIKLANLHNIPTIVLTGTIDKETIDIIHKNNVISYVLKGTPKSTNHAVKFVKRVLRNYNTTVMVVDDSPVHRKAFSDILKKDNINVIEVEDGKKALDILKENQENISVVLTDLEMPGMDGLELTIKIRELYDKDQLAIIAISGTDDTEMINNFLKFGANDYVGKTATQSEIITRVNSNLEVLDLFSQIRDMANKDFLTGAYNRRYFFDSGNSIFLKAKRKNMPVAVAMMDIDNFKIINDTYGHDVGDIAIKEVKRILDRNLRASDLMARFGGEEFCVLFEDISEKNVKKLFERIRKEFEDNIIDVNIDGENVKVNYTISFGVVYGIFGSLSDMVRLSDAALYCSKENGRNQVTFRKF